MSDDRPDLHRRCGSCARFVRVVETVDDNGEVKRRGECVISVWPPPLFETSTCSQWVEKGKFSAPRPAQPRAARPRGHLSPGRAADLEPDLPLTLPEDLLAMDADEFRRVLRDVIREELGVSRVALGARWEGGEIVMKPGKADTQEKRVPIESFFHKIVMMRDKLRVLEQKVNAHPKLSDEEKVQMQTYITGCYGSLTTFNVLFADKADGFSGQKGDE